MIITQSRSYSVPKTANLLACKQWWKVCFPHGDQEKYYRQVYGRAAAKRLANFQIANDKDKSSSTKPAVIENGSNDTKKLNKFTRDEQNCINIFDDPFLFGINEVNENGSDSGIDANCSAKIVNKVESNGIASKEM